MPLVDGQPLGGPPAIARGLADTEASEFEQDMGAQALQEVRSINRYLEELKELELEEGPYSPALAQDLESLGIIYQRNGEHETALATFDKAMHIIRVNDGLFTMDQERLVGRMLESYAALGDIDQVDNHQEYLYYLHQKNFPPGDPRLLAAQRDWADWNIRSHVRRSTEPGATFSFNTNAGPFGDELVPVRNHTTGQVYYVPRNQMLMNNRMGMNDMQSTMAMAVHPQQMVDQRLRLAEQIYSEMEESLKDSKGSERELMEARRRLAGVSYVIKRQMDEQEDALSRNTMLMTRTNQSPSFNQVVTRSYTNGRKLLEEVVDTAKRSADFSAQDVAGALLDLADWHLAFGRNQRAYSLYEEAYGTLIDAGVAAEEADRFLSPTPILQIPAFADHPYTRASVGISDDTDIDYLGYIDVNLTVDRYGNVRRSRIEDTTDEVGNQLRQRLLRNLRSGKFRPHLVAGKPADTEELSFRYYYFY